MSLEGFVSIFAAGHREDSLFLPRTREPNKNGSLNPRKLSGNQVEKQQIVASKIDAMFLEDPTQPQIEVLLQNPEVISLVGGLFQICRERKHDLKLEVELRAEISESVKENEIPVEYAYALEAFLFDGIPLDDHFEGTAI